jgi:hypothetical protein
VKPDATGWLFALAKLGTDRIEKERDVELCMRIEHLSSNASTEQGAILRFVKYSSTPHCGMHKLYFSSRENIVYAVDVCILPFQVQ